jgi:catechol 2,3-dioxygenase-like lactoylglutathione lyase family enzyme
MIDHITIQVEDLQNSRAFYEKVLAVLGYEQNITNEKNTFYGFGVGKDPIFEIVQSTLEHPAHKKVHVAFKAKTKEQVKEFYDVALANGATDNGEPGPRKNYSPTYYAAFVIGPDEHNIEVCLY